MTEETTAIQPYDMNNVLDRPKRMESILQHRYDEISSLLRGSGVEPDRFISTVVHALAANPDVMSCTANSILLAVLDAAKMGLEPTGRFGGAYLIKRGGQATLEVDWRGYIRMAVRSGAISRAKAELVYEGDAFAWELGTSPRIDHTPTGGTARGQEQRGNVTHAYAIAWLPDASTIFEVMTVAELLAIRDAHAYLNGPWRSDPGEMMRKTVVRRLFKYIPTVYNPALAYALEREDAVEQAERVRVSVEPASTAASDAASRRRRLASAVVAGTAPEEPERTAGETASEPPAELIDGQPADPEAGLPA